MFSARFRLVACFLTALALFLIFPERSANAQQVSTGAGARDRKYTATGATAIAPTGGEAFLGFLCMNMSATPVYVGASSGVSSTTGIPFCTDTAACPKGAALSYGSPGWFVQGATDFRCHFITKVQ